MTEAGPGERIEDKSLGELVAQASSGISKLIRAEISLAKMELKVDARKAVVGGALFFVALAVFAPVIIFVGLALAYGLMELFDMWAWAAFLTVAVTYVVVAVLLGVVGVLVVKRIRGAQRTRRTLGDLPEAFRHDPDKPAIAPTD